MTIAFTIARLLLGLIFTVFGANGFFHFIPMQTPPGLAGQFFTAISASGFYIFVFATQLVAGILLLVGRFVPFALALLAPVIANILMFHATMAPGSVAPGILALVLWIACVYQAREHFAPLFEPVVRARRT